MSEKSQPDRNLDDIKSIEQENLANQQKDRRSAKEFSSYQERLAEIKKERPELVGEQATNAKLISDIFAAYAEMGEVLTQLDIIQSFSIFFSSSYDPQNDGSPFIHADRAEVIPSSRQGSLHYKILDPQLQIIYARVLKEYQTTYQEALKDTQKSPSHNSVITSEPISDTMKKVTMHGGFSQQNCITFTLQSTPSSQRVLDIEFFRNVPKNQL